MSIEYLRRLRQNAEARRAMYAPIARVETIKQVIARQVLTCHSMILPDEKNANYGVYDAVDNMAHITQQIAELSQQIKNAQQSNEQECIIDKLYALANFISEINNMEQLRRIYSSGEIIYRLNYISRSKVPINQIKTVVQYMSWITIALTQSKPIIKAEFVTQNKYYVLAIYNMCPEADRIASKTQAAPTAMQLSIKNMFNQLCGEA